MDVDSMFHENSEGEGNRGEVEIEPSNSDSVSDSVGDEVKKHQNFVTTDYAQRNKNGDGHKHIKSISLEGIASAFSRKWRKRKATTFLDGSDSFDYNHKRRKLSFFTNKEIFTKLLSNSVSKLNIPSSSAFELYRKASNSFHTITKLLEFSRRRSFQNTLPTTPDAIYESIHSSISKATCSINFMEAIFLPEFPIKSMVTEDDFTLLNCIGRGAFGCVYQICLKNNPEVVFALKVQKKYKVLSYNIADQVKNEVSIQTSLCHCDFITRSFISWQSRTKLFTLMQCSGGFGDLYNLWRDFGPFSWPLVQIYAAEIATALDYCHRNNVIYRDLKLENVMLTIGGHIQITDFGFAKRLADCDRTATVCGTLQYMAPEVAYGQPYSKYIDWWCFGVLLHVLYTGHYPYPNSKAQTHYQLSYKSYYSMNCSGPLHDLLRKLLDVNLVRRICSYYAVKDHVFFHLFNWNSVVARKQDPYAYISGIEQYRKCKVDDKLEFDDEETWSAFDENYEYGSHECFEEID